MQEGAGGAGVVFREQLLGWLLWSCSRQQHCGTASMAAPAVPLLREGSSAVAATDGWQQLCVRGAVFWLGAQGNLWVCRLRLLN